jgi:hypothetical protein
MSLSSEISRYFVVFQKKNTGTDLPFVYCLFAQNLDYSVFMLIFATYKGSDLTKQKNIHELFSLLKNNKRNE